MDTLNTPTYETDGRIARITLNRPERGNGITLDMPRELAQCTVFDGIARHTAEGYAFQQTS
jgi:enoyl-CoA hydratase/carnithine racemase